MRRPAPYAPLSTTFATSKTGTRLQEKYGLEGLAVWACLIAAAKRGAGEIVLANDQDWQALGVLRPPAFPLSEFLKTTGQLKQTRTTRRGHVVDVQLTHYGDWNDDAHRQTERERKARSDRESNRNKTGRLPEWKRRPIAAEPEAEEELEKGSNEAQLLTPAADGFEPKTLPFTHEHLFTQLLALIGSHADERTPAVLRSYANQATEGQLAKVIESTKQAHARNRARYAVAALRDELAHEDDLF